MKAAPKAPALSVDTFRLRNKVSGNPCALSELLARLSPADRAVVRAAIDDRSIQASAITEVLRERYAYTHKRDTIQKHRTSSCRWCERVP